MLKQFFAMLMAGLLLAHSALARAELDLHLPKYHAVSGITGDMTSDSSDTLATLMTLWAETFQDIYPTVRVQIQATGSSTAPPALIEGTSGFGPMSREMKDREIAAFEAKYGYKPTAIRVAIDALAVFVHRDNPLASFTIPQVDAIFSATRWCGETETIQDWRQLDVDLGRMQLFGRNSVSGTYGYFKQHALCKGDFKNKVNEQPGSASVVQSVAHTLTGIGYSSLSYKTSGVRALALAPTAASAAIEPTSKTIVSGQYPLSRYLYIYVNKPPNKALAPLDREFVKMILSETGQQIVLKDGYIPLPAAVIARELEKLQ